jgi:photoactive yellow protein
MNFRNGSEPKFWQAQKSWEAQKSWGAQGVWEAQRMQSAIRIDSPVIVEQLEGLSAQELDNLPFGVIRIDSAGRVLFYSKTEARLSGYGEIPTGRNIFELSRCLGSDDFKGRITTAVEEGPVNLDIGWSGDFASPKRDLRFRVRSSTPDSIWILVERD